MHNGLWIRSSPGRAVRKTCQVEMRNLLMFCVEPLSNSSIILVWHHPPLRYKVRAGSGKIQILLVQIFRTNGTTLIHNITKQRDKTTVILHKIYHVRLSNRIPPDMICYAHFNRPFNFCERWGAARLVCICHTIPEPLTDLEWWRFNEDEISWYILQHFVKGYCVCFINLGAIRRCNQLVKHGGQDILHVREAAIENNT